MWFTSMYQCTEKYVCSSLNTVNQILNRRYIEHVIAKDQMSNLNEANIQWLGDKVFPLTDISWLLAEQISKIPKQ